MVPAGTEGRVIVPVARDRTITDEEIVSIADQAARERGAILDPTPINPDAPAPLAGGPPTHQVRYIMFRMTKH